MNKQTPLLATCPQLIDAFHMLHMYMQPYLDDLIDIWLESPPEINVKQKLLLDLPSYDPRHDTITRRWVLIGPLAQWIRDVSERQGMPFTYQQAVNILGGIPDYGNQSKQAGRPQITTH